MAPGRPTVVKTEGGKGSKGGKTSIGGIGGRGVAGKGLGLGKSSAKRHRYSVFSKQLDGNNMLTHSKEASEGQHPGNRQRRYSPTRSPWWCQAHLGHDLRRDTPGTQVLPREGHARKYWRVVLNEKLSHSLTCSFLLLDRTSALSWKCASARLSAPATLCGR